MPYLERVVIFFKNELKNTQKLLKSLSLSVWDNGFEVCFRFAGDYSRFEPIYLIEAIEALNEYPV